MWSGEMPDCLGYLRVWVSNTPQHSNTFMFINAHAENVLVDLGKDSKAQLNKLQGD